MSKKRSNRSVQQNRLDEALAALIRNTRRTSRQLSLLEIAEWLDVAIEGCGTLRKVADRIGLSSQMLRQFLAVKQLAPAVQKLFSERKLDSVDMASHLRNLERTDQEFAARETITGDLNTADIRAICEFRNENPDIDIQNAVKQIKATRNIKQYIIEFVVRGPMLSRDVLQRRFADALGTDNIESLQMTCSIGTVVVNHSGRSRLRVLAKQYGVTQAEAVNWIVMGELSK